jgi:phage replication initiation protein
MKNVNNNPHVVNETDFGSTTGTDAPAPSQLMNEGGTVAMVDSSLTPLDSSAPRLVTRGESIQTHEVISDDGESFVVVIKNGRSKLIHIPKPKADGNPNAAIVDFLNCTFYLGNDFNLNNFFQRLLPIIGNAFAPAVDRGIGKYGYKRSFALGNSKALFAFGGNGNTGFLSFSGESCHQIPNWTLLVNYLETDLDARITRWDGAYDDFEGTRSVDLALSMYQDNLFNNGGRKPLMDQRGNWIEPDGRGRTLYIGSSDNGKLARIYEKGMQLGIPYHSWVRWEVQLGNRDREIPWEAVLEPGKYLAGSYPKALDWVSKDQSRIKTLQRTANIGYDALNHWASVAYGKHINAMMEKEGSAEKVIEILRRNGLPARLDLPILPNFGKVFP